MRHIPLVGLLGLFGISGNSQNIGMTFDDAQENYILVPDDPAVNFITDFSVELWVRPRSIDHNMLLVQEGKCSTSDWSYEVWIRPDSLVEFVFDCTGSCPADNFYTTTTKILPGVCTHIVVTYSSSGPLFYLNGVLDSCTLIGIPHCTLPTSDGPLRIGSYILVSGISTSFYDGYMDELRLWNIVLTPAEVLANYNSPPLGGDEDGLVLYYRFEGTATGAGEVVENSALITGTVLDGATYSLGSTSPYPDTVQCTSYSDVGPSELKANTWLEVFPNPGSDFVVFQNSSKGLEFLFELFDLKGNRVHSEIFTEFPYTLSVKQFPSSSYIFKITATNPTEQFIGRFLVE